MARQLKKSVKQTLYGALFGITALGATYAIGHNAGKADAETKADPYIAKLNELEERAVEDLRHASGVTISHEEMEDGNWKYINDNGEEVQLNEQEQFEYMGYLTQEGGLRAQFEVEREEAKKESPAVSKKVALANN